MQKTRNTMSKVLRLPRKITMDTSRVQRAVPAPKITTHLLETSLKYCACHTKRFSTCYETRLNVTKSHACHAKRSNETFKTSNNDTFCKTYHTHGYTALTRTVVDGCERLRTVVNGQANTPSTPDPQSETGTLAMYSGKRSLTEFCRFRAVNFYFSTNPRKNASF